MKNKLLTIIALCFMTNVCLAQEQDFAKQWRIGFGPKILSGIPSEHTNPRGTLAYDYGEMTGGITLWNPSSRISVGTYLSLFGTYLLTHPDGPENGFCEFALGGQLGLEAQFHLLPDHESSSQRWDLTLNTSLCVQYTKFIPIDYLFGLSLSATWYFTPQWGLFLESGVNGFFWGRWEYFDPRPGRSNSILRLGVSHRF